jgi:hypothetical protein
LTLSRTINLTLLSDSLMAKSMNLEAAANSVCSTTKIYLLQQQDY